MTAVLVFLIIMTLAFVVAGIAQYKGRLPPTWLLYGVLGWLIAIPYLLMQTKRRSGKKITPLLYFLPAIILLAVTVLLFLYQYKIRGPS